MSLQKHLKTISVSILAEAVYNKCHMDAAFATATIRHLEELASILGPKQVFFISQDNKAGVPIGLTAANKQAPLLMHVEYLVTLPDHNWVVAPSHKLIPSAYASINIEANKLAKRSILLTLLYLMSQMLIDYFDLMNLKIF